MLSRIAAVAPVRFHPFRMGDSEHGGGRSPGASRVDRQSPSLAMSRYHEFFVGVCLNRTLQKHLGLFFFQIRPEVIPRLDEPAMEALIVRQGG
jgi:hypothetical protein